MVFTHTDKKKVAEIQNMKLLSQLPPSLGNQCVRFCAAEVFAAKRGWTQTIWLCPDKTVLRLGDETLQTSA